MFRSPSAPRLFVDKSHDSLRPSLSFKRSEPCMEGEMTPVQTKRRKSVVERSTPDKVGVSYGGTGLSFVCQLIDNLLPGAGGGWGEFIKMSP